MQIALVQDKMVPVALVLAGRQFDAY